MYNYIIGTITEILNNAIVLENQGIGYIIYVPNPYVYRKEETKKVYLYQSISENDMRLYGFQENEQKELFLNLIKVKGIGPKSAISILAVGNVDEIMQAIENENVKFLKSFPGIGPKAAGQIILDLKGKIDITKTSPIFENKALDEAKEVLIALGYKDNEVDKVMRMIQSEPLDTNGYVKKALQLITKI